MVTVDDASQYNKVIWEKGSLTDVDSFRIYREVLSSFVHIGSVHRDSLSEYVDSVYLPAANPNTTNFRYKISILDTCGNESLLSTHHRTIFLQANQGVGGVVNLNWVPYEGEQVDFYRILCDSTGSGVFEAIDSVPGSNTVYTDLSPPLTGSISYLLESIWSVSCSPSRAGIITTRSNIKHAGSISTQAKEKEIISTDFVLYPNPAANEVTMQYSSAVISGSIQVYDALGQLMYSLPVQSSDASNGVFIKKLDISSYPKGIYIVNLHTENGNTFKRLVIQ